MKTLFFYLFFVMYHAGLIVKAKLCLERKGKAEEKSLG